MEAEGDLLLATLEPSLAHNGGWAPGRINLHGHVKLAHSAQPGTASSCTRLTLQKVKGQCAAIQDTLRPLRQSSPHK